MTVRALETIRHSGQTFKKGDIIRDLKESDLKRLLDLKSAERLVTEKDVEHVVTERTVDPTLFQELRNDLNEAFNAEELKREAKAAGVRFDSSDTKEEVMAAVINQGKVDLLLEEGE